jgi:ubiquinone/menaquinone biosynthesis C-methylase UbiE
MALERVLEAEVMDTPQEAMDYDELDHSEANESFVSDFVATGDATGDILDVGTGTGQIPVLLCERQAECRVMAADLAVSMLEVARYNIEIAGLIERIQLAHMDAKELPSPDDYFDAVICNGMLHHLAEPAAVLAEAVRVAKPGGRLFFRDLLRPDSEDELQRLVLSFAGEDSERQQGMYADSLRAGLTLEEMQACLVGLGFAADTLQRTGDRHWTWSALKPSVPGDSGS